MSPRTPIEHAVADLFAACLDVESTSSSIDDDFFQRGGTSIMAIQLLSRIEQAFNVRLRLEHVLAAPTIAGLASALEDALLARVETMSDAEAHRLLEGS